MLSKLQIFNDVSISALVAYTHYLGIILCFGALIFERIVLKINLSKKETISIIIADVIYGIAGLAILITGILRVKYYGQGGEFYTSNPLFWSKFLYTLLLVWYLFTQQLLIYYGQFL